MITETARFRLASDTVARLEKASLVRMSVRGKLKQHVKDLPEDQLAIIHGFFPEVRKSLGITAGE